MARRLLLLTMLCGMSALGCASWPADPAIELAPWQEAAKGHDVEILRDAFGVPHVYGKTDADVAFGLAYAHAEDDFATIQRTLLQTRGRLAAVDGADAAPFDYLAHVLGVYDDVGERYATEVPEDVRAIAEAYAEGMNLYAAENPKKVLRGWYPAGGRDVVAGFVFRTPFFYGLQRTLIELLADERMRDISAPPREGAYRPVPLAPVQMGSNAAAVAPSRSADGATRLLVNSHQPYTGPVAWYEARLKSDEGLDMAGGVFPGSPLVLHGTGRTLGWASTVNLPDLADVYVLDIHPDDPDLYRYDGEWKRLDKSEVTIPVKLFGPFTLPVSQEVLRSVHGPVLRTEHGTYALRFVGEGEIRQLEQYYRMNRATDHDTWARAMAMQALPSINYVYADREGRIAYYYNVKSPVRAKGWDWQAYLPGDRSDIVWDEFHDWTEIPAVVSPRSGFVANANHSPFRATTGDENPDPAAFGPEWGIETSMTNRGLRLLEQFGADESITAEEFRAYKYDKTYSTKSEAQRITQEILALDFSDDARLSGAQAHLAKWDFELDIEDRHAALGIVTATPVVVAALSGQEPPTLEQAFRDAIDTLEKHHGTVDVAWGEVNRFQRGSLDLPIAGGPDVLRAVESFVLREDGRYVSNSGDTYIMFVTWDADGTQTVETIHQFGSATLDKDSPHYADQVELFRTEQTRMLPLEREALLPEVTRRTTPGR